MRIVVARMRYLIPWKDSHSNANLASTRQHNADVPVCQPDKFRRIWSVFSWPVEQHRNTGPVTREAREIVGLRETLTAGQTFLVAGNQQVVADEGDIIQIGRPAGSLREQRHEVVAAALQDAGEQPAKASLIEEFGVIPEFTPSQIRLFLVTAGDFSKIGDVLISWSSRGFPS